MEYWWGDLAADVFVDVPDEIDISDMRSQGMQPDEQPLPETPGLYFLLTWIAFSPF